MRQWGSLLWMDLYRAVLSTRFVWTVLFIIGVMVISSYGYIDEHTDVLYLLNGALNTSGSSIFIFCIAPILPFGMAFADDVADEAYPFWIVRTGIGRYAVSKFLVAAAAGFLSIAVSIVGFILVLSVFFPLFVASTSGDPYAVFLEQGSPARYILQITVHYALSGALFSGGAMTVSAFIPNRFSVVAVPVVVYWVLMRLTSLTPIPEFLKIGNVVQAIIGKTPEAALMNKMVPTLLMLLILLHLFASKTKRRMLVS